MSPALSEFLARRTQGYADTQALDECLNALIQQGLDQLPAPASGHVLDRWRALALVGGHDLSLCKLYEGHTDALAIMDEVGAAPVQAGSSWGMWASEPPKARVTLQKVGDGQVELHGVKAWCSGAAVLSHGLMTAWDEQNRQQLVAVAMAQPGVTFNDSRWHAVGMAATGSGEVRLTGAHGTLVGEPGAYLARPGFWQGGIGIAACWYGAAAALAAHLQEQARTSSDPHLMAHLGAVDVALHSAGAALQQAARIVDADPGADAQRLARRVRAVVEHSAQRVISHVGRALGAGPFCSDEHFARLSADLPVFLRQSHAERDLAALGELAAAPDTFSTTRTWTL
jgi:hypothetical protein